MFVRVEERPQPKWRWATPLIVGLSIVIAIYLGVLPEAERAAMERAWGSVPTELFDWRAGWLYLAAQCARLVTALFIHADTVHLLGNLMFLLLFGFAVEKVFRGRWCLALFLVCGATANLITGLFLFREGSSSVLIGSSGGVSGLMGAYLYLFPRANLGVVLPLGLYFQFERVPAQHLIGLWFLLQVLYTIAGPSHSAIAWLAHVIGFVVGFLLAILLRPLLYRRARDYLEEKR